LYRNVKCIVTEEFNGYCVVTSSFSITSSAVRVNPSGIHIYTGNSYIDIESLYVTMFPRAR
jgi:hypothetical protein